jgi:hypothetical protein
VHAFTASRSLANTPSKRELRIARSGASNLAPASTGAAITITKTLPQYERRFDVIGMRTPFPIKCRLIYYCDMNESLTTPYSNQVINEDNYQFYYNVKPYELSNALGHMITVLQEYNFIKTDDIFGQLFGKLYKTKEGNWDDLEESKMVTEKKILRMLKSAIDAKENIPGYKDI